MHARIPDVETSVNLKWRGMALGEFDGKTWFNSSSQGEALRVRNRLLRLADDDQRRRRGQRINYEVQLKLFASDVLFIAGRPEFIQIDSALIIQTPSDGYRLGFRTANVLRYGVYSFLEESAIDAPAFAPVLSPENYVGLLELPRIDARINALAHEVTSGSLDRTGESASAGKNTFKPPMPTLLSFPRRGFRSDWPTSCSSARKGHCEYFASAMAVMLRIVGIPSRVATGFQGGEYNPISGWHLIRASDAHSWVEAFLAGPGLDYIRSDASR